MKKLFTFILCLICLQNYAQDQGYFKTFPGNESVLYLTNSNLVKGLSFFHKTAADTSNTVFYIEDFKYSDIQLFAEKIKVSNLKICIPNYKSNPGDFIFTFDNENEIIFYYHTRKEDLLKEKII